MGDGRCGVEREKKNTNPVFHVAESKGLDCRRRDDRVFLSVRISLNLPVDGVATKQEMGADSRERANTKWARSWQAFTAETSKRRGQQGEGFYASADFQRHSGQRRAAIQIGWLRAPSPGMAFNQCMSLPLELKLLTTPDGIRLARQPVSRAYAPSWAKSIRQSGGGQTGDANPLATARGELLECAREF